MVLAATAVVVAAAIAMIEGGVVGRRAQNLTVKAVVLAASGVVIASIMSAVAMIKSVEEVLSIPMKELAAEIGQLVTVTAQPTIAGAEECKITLSQDEATVARQTRVETTVMGLSGASRDHQ